MAVISKNDTLIVVFVKEVLSHLQRIGSGKSSGPDNLPNWVLKSFTDLLTEPVIECVFPGGTATRGVEASKRCPNPKNKIVLDVNKDLRPISLTSSLHV